MKEDLGLSFLKSNNQHTKYLVLQYKFVCTFLRNDLKNGYPFLFSAFFMDIVIYLLWIRKLTTVVKNWAMIIVLFFPVLVCLTIAFCVWCVWRFFKKKRPKDKKKGKDGKEKVMSVEVDSLYKSGSFFSFSIFLSSLSRIRISVSFIQKLIFLLHWEEKNTEESYI